MGGWQEQIDLRALAAWMDGQMLGAGPIAHPRLLTGGTQNMLLRFERQGRIYVLRRPPPCPRPESDETMRREMRVLAALGPTDIPHPRLIAACPETDIIGVSFYLTDLVDGFNATAGLPEAYRRRSGWRRRMALAMVEGAADLGALDHVAIGLDDFGQPDRYLERQAPRWRAQYESYSVVQHWPGPAALPGVDRVSAWLESHCPAVFRPGLMHGDYHFANVMFRRDEPELAAIVDWELATIGDPLIDLGWILATWPERPDASDTPVRITPWTGFPTPADLIARYRAHSGRDLSALDWYVVLGCFKLAILLEGSHARACAGEAPRAVGDRLHASAVLLMKRALARIV
jgi:aminoglycoside phosphotransferase (APT) family kinase protein